jgi:hypothetical protein
MKRPAHITVFSQNVGTNSKAPFFKVCPISGTRFALELTTENFEQGVQGVQGVFENLAAT